MILVFLQLIHTGFDGGVFYEIVSYEFRYRLHFDLEGDTGIVARAIGTAARLQRSPANGQRRIPLLG